MKHVDAVRLPSGDDFIAPVTILDAEGRVVRVVSAAEFRRDHATVVSVPVPAAPRRGRQHRVVFAAPSPGAWFAPTAW
jgi:hypothetical protein